MARPLRIAYPGALYHITVRGNNKNPIFSDDEDRSHFLRILAKTVQHSAWLCYAYCLMDNHFHLLLETTQANISQGMRRLNGLFTQFMNWRHRRVGHLFQGRFGARLIEKESYFLEVARYVVLNAQRAGMVPAAADYRWSSFRATAGLEPAPAFLSVNSLLTRFGSDREQAQKAYVDFVNEGAMRCPWDLVKGQIFLGSETFLDKMRQFERPLDGIPAPTTRLLRPPLELLLKEGDAGLIKATEAGYSAREIGLIDGRHQTSISRQLRRLTAGAGVRSAFEALTLQKRT